MKEKRSVNEFWLKIILYSEDGLFKSVSIKFSISLLLRHKKNSYLKLGNQIKFLSINKKILF